MGSLAAVLTNLGMDLAAAPTPAEATQAAFILGAAAARCEAVGLTFAADDEASLERTRESLRALLGDAAFTRAWARGRAMAPNSVIADVQVMTGGHDTQVAASTLHTPGPTS